MLCFFFGQSIECLFLFLDFLLATSDTASSSGGNKTDLLTGGGITTDSRGLTNMLMITTTVGMFDGIHGNTSDLRPAVTLSLVLVISTASLENGLVDTATTGDDADHTTVIGLDDLLGAGWQLHTGLVGVGVVADDGGVVAGCTGNLAAIARLLLEIADDGTFGHCADWQNVTDLEGCLATGVDELTGVHAFDGDEQFLSDLILVWITEGNTSQGSATAGIVEDFLFIRE